MNAKLNLCSNPQASKENKKLRCRWNWMWKNGKRVTIARSFFSSQLPRTTCFWRTRVCSAKPLSAWERKRLLKTQLILSLALSNVTTKRRLALCVYLKLLARSARVWTKGCTFKCRAGTSHKSTKHRMDYPKIWAANRLKIAVHWANQLLQNHLPFLKSKS